MIAAILMGAACARSVGLPLLPALLVEAPAVAAMWFAARRRGGTILVSGGRAGLVAGAHRNPGRWTRPD